MKKHQIPYHKTGYFSDLIVDYLQQNEKVKPFYNHFPNQEGFLNQILEKQGFSTDNREVLANVLEEQYQGYYISDATKNNIANLREEHTFTITTGHQLNLFTGPLYFLYKIVTTINLAKELQEIFPKYQFVPVYWMATEDHDFEEINHFYHDEQKFQWNKQVSGGVGNISTKGLEEFFDDLRKILGNSIYAKELEQLFSEAYINHSSLSEATLFLVNQLFGDKGLVILDANHRSLKRSFQQTMKDELLQQTAYKSVQKTSEKLNENYFSQVNPRLINLFYLKDDLRERIVLEEGIYKVTNSNISFTKEEIVAELDQYPERFSPNVLMRPLYQETILPNICYIGGAGELAYWFQLKSYFKKVKVPFPVLLLRNSVLLVTNKQSQKLQKLNVDIADLFLPTHLLEKKRVQQLSKISIDFSLQKAHLQQQFLDLKEVAKQTDISFIGAVNAQEKKQLKGLENLEKRLLRAEKRRLRDELNRVVSLQNQLFPNHTLQERRANFSDFYKEIGKDLLSMLFTYLKPLEQEFTILTIGNK